MRWAILLLLLLPSAQATGFGGMEVDDVSEAGIEYRASHVTLTWKTALATVDTQITFHRHVDDPEVFQFEDATIRIEPRPAQAGRLSVMAAADAEAPLPDAVWEALGDVPLQVMYPLDTEPTVYGLEEACLLKAPRHAMPARGDYDVRSWGQVVTITTRDGSQEFQTGKEGGYGAGQNRVLVEEAQALLQIWNATGRIDLSGQAKIYATHCGAWVYGQDQGRIGPLLQDVPHSAQAAGPVKAWLLMLLLPLALACTERSVIRAVQGGHRWAIAPALLREALRRDHRSAFLLGRAAQLAGWRHLAARAYEASARRGEPRADIALRRATQLRQSEP